MGKIKFTFIRDFPCLQTQGGWPTPLGSGGRACLKSCGPTPLLWGRAAGLQLICTTTACPPLSTWGALLWVSALCCLIPFRCWEEAGTDRREVSLGQPACRHLPYSSHQCKPESQLLTPVPSQLEGKGAFSPKSGPSVTLLATCCARGLG